MNNNTLPAVAIYNGTLVMVFRNTLANDTVEVSPVVASAEMETLHPKRRESLSGGRTRVNVDDLEKATL